jgi:hypothetical protein
LEGWHCSACGKCNYGLSVPYGKCGGVSNITMSSARVVLEAVD